MTVVVDASAAIEIALNKEMAEKFQQILADADLVLAPDIFPAEVTNVFWKYGSMSNLPATDCQSGISCCLDLVDDYIDTIDLCREVFSMAIGLKHSAYDIFYLVVARRNDAAVLSRDRKMMDAAKLLKVKTAR